MYLNRHGYNGLCRYNNSRREFNVPFGSYVRPYFPEAEMNFFHEKSQSARFLCEDFSATLRRVRKGHVVYCDPPYVPLSSTANFTAYRPGRFCKHEQLHLAHLAQRLAVRGIPVLVSNHDTEFTRKAYVAANIKRIAVSRLISCNASKRTAVNELLALFGVQ